MYKGVHTLEIGNESKPKGQQFLIGEESLRYWLVGQHVDEVGHNGPVAVFAESVLLTVNNHVEVVTRVWGTRKQRGPLTGTTTGAALKPTSQLRKWVTQHRGPLTGTTTGTALKPNSQHRKGGHSTFIDP